MEKTRLRQREEMHRNDGVTDSCLRRISLTKSSLYMVVRHSRYLTRSCCSSSSYALRIASRAGNTHQVMFSKYTSRQEIVMVRTHLKSPPPNLFLTHHNSRIWMNEWICIYIAYKNVHTRGHDHSISLTNRHEIYIINSNTWYHKTKYINEKSVYV